MQAKIVNYRAKRIIGRYSSYTDFAKHASKAEKKIVLQSTLFDANKLQRHTAGL